MVGLVLEGFENPGKSSLLIIPGARDFSQFGGIQVFYSINRKIIAFCNVIGYRILSLRTRTRFKVSTCKNPLISCSVTDEVDASLSEVEHLLGKTPDAIHCLKGIFISRHGI